MTDVLEGLVPLLSYQQSRAHLFPSLESARWFVQMHRAELTQADAVLKLTGRVYVSPGAFDDVVLSVGKKAAQKALA